MLVLSRNINEAIRSEHMRIVILEVRGNKVRVGIEAAKEYAVHREEVWLKIHGGESCGGQSDSEST